MPGMLGVFIKDSANVNRSTIVDTIDLLNASKPEILAIDNDFMAVTTLQNTALNGLYYYQDEKYTACLSGDFIDYSSIPWPTLIKKYQSHTFEWFANLQGRFAIALYDRFKRELHLISDRTSQYPIYYTVNNTYFVFSTALSTFTTLPQNPGFDIDWLYEYLFFNYPIGQTTFLKNVKRMPPASVLYHNRDSNKASLSAYASPLKPDKETLKGRKALNKALSIFQDRVPKYFDTNCKTLLGISGGFDSRTLLAFAPATADLETYTYGMAGCADLKFAADLRETLGLPHKRITFDQNFVTNLSSLIYKTVWLSNGLQGINRSTLLHVYKTLTNNGQQTPVVISGVSGDHFFRGHGNVPSIISKDMQQIFMTGKFSVDRSLFAHLFGNYTSYFEAHINEVIKQTAQQYGDLDLPTTHLAYLVYEVAPKYFAGEAALADNYVTFRVPYWDTEIINLAYQIEFSTINFSRFLPIKKDTYRENVLQAYLISQNKKFTEIPINGLPPQIFARDNKGMYQLYRAIKSGPTWLKNRLRPRNDPPLEDWNKWFRNNLHSELAQLLSEKSLIANYLNANFFKVLKQTNNIHWLGKLATAEIILRLIRDRWTLPTL